MSQYKVAKGHDVALGSLNTISPQPTVRPMEATRRTDSADLTITDEGRFVEMKWSVLNNATAYQALLAQFGLDTARQAEVTVYVRDETMAYVRMNGTAVRPRPGKDVDWNRSFPRNIVILVKALSPSS